MDDLIRKLAALHVPADPTAVMDRVLDCVLDCLGAQRGFLLVSPVVAPGADSAARVAGLVAGASRQVDHGTAGEAARAALKRAMADKQVLLVEGTMLAAPLVRGGHAIGVIYLHGTFAEPDRLRLAAITEHALAAIEHARERERLTAKATQLEAVVAQEVTRVFASRAIVGSGPAARELRATIERLAPAPATVLITGEPGTGKELVARALHAQSARAHGPFIVLDAAALPANALEAELLGHERDASDRRLGRFEMADGGTLFVDGVDALETTLQIKVLRVLQERAIERVGGLEPRPIDVRFLAATHADLEERVAEGTFRQDLFDRLRAFPIAVPALRERREDVPELAAQFAKQLAPRVGRPFRAFSPAALERLSAHDWPGNLRELRAVVERALIVDAGPVIQAESLAL